MKTIYEVWFIDDAIKSRVYMNTNYLNIAAQFIQELTEEGKQVWLQIVENNK